MLEVLENPPVFYLKHARAHVLLFFLVHIPDPHGLVPAARGQEVAAGRPTHAFNFVLMT